MSVGSLDVVQRIAAIQQMTSSLLTGTPAGFSTALGAAQGATATAQASAAAPASTGAVTGMPYAAEITAAASKYGLDPALLAGLVKQESGFNPSARSGAGAQGLTQLMPATARGLGVTDATDPVQALDGGAKYLKQQLDRFGGDERLALAAYNAGPGAVQRFGGVPPYAETQAYVKRVMSNRDEFAAAALPAAVPSAPGTAISATQLLSTSSGFSGSGTSSSLQYPTT